MSLPQGAQPHSSKATAMRVVFNRLLKEESGVTAIEYALIAAFIALAIVTALTTIGGSLSSTFNKVANDI
jgi:pilus assembly protein Flp/PilA